MGNDELFAQLRAVDLFADLKDSYLRDIADRGSVVQHPAGSLLAEQGRSGVGFHLLLSGTADVEVGGQSRGTMKAGDHFGEISLIDGQPRSADVRVGAEGATTFALTSWNFTPLLDEHPEISRALLKGLCARLRNAEALLDQR
ncbi:MAG: cyclic nucleotide-binding domain-containing protein [Actinomycetes bacterium]